MRSLNEGCSAGNVNKGGIWYVRKKFIFEIGNWFMNCHVFLICRILRGSNFVIINSSRTSVLTHLYQVLPKSNIRVSCKVKL